MSKVIEIIDSDDDSTTDNLQIDETVSEPEFPIDRLNEEDKEITQCSLSMEQQADKQKNKNRRKAAHQVMRASPEMQFHTITFDDIKKKRKSKRKNLAPANAATTSTTTTITTSKPEPEKTTTANSAEATMVPKPPTVTEILSAACDELLNLEKTHEIIRKISEHRIRINFLLNAFNMKEMTFTLGSDLERLKLQLNERLIRSNTTKPSATTADELQQTGIGKSVTSVSKET